MEEEKERERRKSIIEDAENGNISPSLATTIISSQDNPEGSSSFSDAAATSSHSGASAENTRQVQRTFSRTNSNKENDEYSVNRIDNEDPAIHGEVCDVTPADTEGKTPKRHSTRTRVKEKRRFKHAGKQNVENFVQHDNNPATRIDVKEKVQPQSKADKDAKKTVVGGAASHAYDKEISRASDAVTTNDNIHNHRKTTAVGAVAQNESVHGASTRQMKSNVTTELTRSGNSEQECGIKDRSMITREPNTVPVARECVKSPVRAPHGDCQPEEERAKGSTDRPSNGDSAQHGARPGGHAHAGTRVTHDMTCHAASPHAHDLRSATGVQRGSVPTHMPSKSHTGQSKQPQNVSRVTDRRSVLRSPPMTTYDGANNTVPSQMQTGQSKQPQNVSRATDRPSVLNSPPVTTYHGANNTVPSAKMQTGQSEQSQRQPIDGTNDSKGRHGAQPEKSRARPVDSALSGSRNSSAGQTGTPQSTQDGQHKQTQDISAGSKTKGRQTEPKATKQKRKTNRAHEKEGSKPSGQTKGKTEDPNEDKGQARQKKPPLTPGHKQPATDIRKKWKTTMKTTLEELYPDAVHKVYFVPPIFFNVSKRKQHKHLPGVFVYDSTPQSNTRGNEATERSLLVLREALPCLYPNQGVFVMSCVTFEDYLNKPFPHDHSGPQAVKQYAPFPRPEDMDPQYRRGEIDVMILTKDHGLVILDIKAVGDTFQDIQATEDVEQQLIHKVLEKALLLMRKEKQVVLHTISDISSCTVPVSTILVLPNLTRNKLTKALDCNPGLRQALEECMRNWQPVEEYCLCADDLPAKHQPVTDGGLNKFIHWWKRTLKARPCTLDDDAFEEIIGRFCGPLSTLSVWTAELPRAEIRTVGQAVSETARRFSTLTLTKQQMDILESSEPLVYIAGPPGAGKAVVLTLRGVQWLREGKFVCVLTTNAGPSPAALVIVEKMKTIVQHMKDVTVTGEVDTENVEGCSENCSLQDICSSLVRRLQDKAGGRGMCLIVDEVHGESVQAIVKIIVSLLGEHCSLWCAGTWARNCPSGFAQKVLRRPVRCPPAVQTLLSMVEPSNPGSDVFENHVLTKSAADKTSGTSSMMREFDYVTHSTDVTEDMPFPLPTTGVPVKLFCHDGHVDAPVVDCEDCAKHLAGYLKNHLRLGTDLTPGDVVIVTADTEAVDVNPRPLFARVLRKELGVRVQVIGQCADDQRSLAFPSPDTLILTNFELVIGLERKVVVFLPQGSPAGQRSLNNSRVDDTDTDHSGHHHTAAADVVTRGGAGVADVVTRGGAGVADVVTRGGAGVADVVTRGGAGVADVVTRGGAGVADVVTRGGVGVADVVTRGGVGVADVVTRGGAGVADVVTRGGAGVADVVTRGGAGVADVVTRGGAGVAAVDARGGVGVAAAAANTAVNNDSQMSEDVTEKEHAREEEESDDDGMNDEGPLDGGHGSTLDVQNPSDDEGFCTGSEDLKDLNSSVDDTNHEETEEMTAVDNSRDVEMSQPEDHTSSRLDGRNDPQVPMSYISRLRHALGQLSKDNTDRMWHAVSRSTGHVVIFHFHNE